MFVVAQLTPANALWVTAGLLVVVFIIEIFTVARPGTPEPAATEDREEVPAS